MSFTPRSELGEPASSRTLTSTSFMAAKTASSHSPSRNCCSIRWARRGWRHPEPLGGGQPGEPVLQRLFAQPRDLEGVGRVLRSVAHDEAMSCQPGPAFGESVADMWSTAVP